MGKDYRSRVYAWEGQWQHWNLKMFDSVRGPRLWIRWACRWYRSPAPVVRALPAHGELSYYYSLDHSINLQPIHWNISTALHESAHAILTAATENYWEDHGPEWLGVYLWLLVRAAQWPTVALKASAKAAGLPWSPISPTKFRRLVKATQRD